MEVRRSLIKNKNKNDNNKELFTIEGIDLKKNN